MGYVRTLVARWSRRDYLTVVIVAVTTAFLVGTTVLLFAIGSQTTAIAHALSASATVEYDHSYADASANATGDEIVLPIATVHGPNGSDERIVGIPDDAPRQIEGASVGWDPARLPQAPANASVYGPGDTRRQKRLIGEDDTRRVVVVPHPEKTVLPPSWYVADVGTVDRLGTTGALVVEPPSENDGAVVPTRGVPFVSAYPFLVGGIHQVMRLLALATLAGAVVVLIVVYNVTRMSVRNRLETIKVVRATGGQRTRVLALFGLRASLLVVVGVSLGYALGVIIMNATVNTAIYAGLPIALHPAVTAAVTRTLLPAFVVLLGVGGAGGVLAALPATHRWPASLTSEVDAGGASIPHRRLRRVLTPTLLNWRVLLPTTATLSVFALTVLLVASLAGVLAPLSQTSHGAVLQAGASNPLGSSLDPGYAQVLREEGVKASPEIILAEMTDGRPYLARGANYTAFAAVSDARLVAGHRPRSGSQVVVGRDFAATFGLAVGDTLTLGGSTSPAVARVRVVGVFVGPGITDDQLVVPLSTAQHLSTKRDRVQLIRTKGSIDSQSEAGANGIVVTDVRSPKTVPANEPVNVSVSVQNFDSRRRSRTVSLTVGDVTRSRSVTLPAGGRRQLTFSPRIREPGNYSVRVGSRVQSVEVLRPDALQLPLLPRAAPPGSTLIVPVTTADGHRVRNATVAFGNRAVRTNRRGVAVVTVPNRTGQYSVVATKGERTTDARSITVRDGEQRQFAGRIQVNPKRGSVFTSATANVTLGNAWGRNVTQNVTLVAPGSTTRKRVTLPPGATTSTRIRLSSDGDGRLSPGTYTLRVVSNGTQIASTEYTVTGDRRIFSTLARSDRYSPGSGFGQAIRTAFGNLNFLLVAMLVLVGLMTVGGTTATFTQAIHGRRRTIGIYRATGASHRRIVRLVVSDVLRFSVPSTVLAVVVAIGALQVLRTLGLLTVFGISTPATTSVPSVIATLFVGIGLAVVSALLAVGLFLRPPPRRLLGGGGIEPPSQGEYSKAGSDENDR